MECSRCGLLAGALSATACNVGAALDSDAAAQVRAPRLCPLALCFVKRERRVRVECSPGKVSERLVRSGIAPYLFSNQLHWVGGLAHAVARRGFL